MNAGMCRALPRVARIGMTIALGVVLIGCKKDNAAAGGSPADPAVGSANAKAAPAGSGALPEPDPEFLAYAKKQVDLAYESTDRDPPTAAPKPERGKKVWIISPGQAGESASIPTNAAKEAGEAIGWKMTIFDGKLDPSTYPTGIRQAVAAKADGIILDAIDCAVVRQALLEARAAKVKTVAFNALDCNDPSVKGEALYDGMLAPGPFPDYATGVRAWGATKADWVVTQTKGRAKVIEFKQDEFLVVKYIREGFEQEMAKCKIVRDRQGRGSHARRFRPHAAAKSARRALATSRGERDSRSLRHAHVLRCGQCRHRVRTQ